MLEIIDCSSEVPGCDRHNVLAPGPCAWKGAAGASEHWILLKCDAPFDAVDIVNAGSATVSMFAGRSRDSLCELVHETTLMSEADVMQGRNRASPRLFTRGDSKLKFDTTDGLIEYLRVVVRQPHDANEPYGLCFISISRLRPATLSMHRTPFQSTISTATLPSSSSRIPLQSAPTSLCSSEPAYSALPPPSAPAHASSHTPVHLSSTAPPPSAPARASSHTPVHPSPTAPPPSAPAPASLQDCIPSHKRSLSSVVCSDDSQHDPQPSAKRACMSAPLSLVTFVLSGFVNPQRGQLRDTATKLGASYRGGWSPDCTHLICAFAGTPKYLEVRERSPRAYIVNAEWIDACARAGVRVSEGPYGYGKDREDPPDPYMPDDAEITVLMEGSAHYDVVEEEGKAAAMDDGCASDVTVPDEEPIYVVPDDSNDDDNDDNDDNNNNNVLRESAGANSAPYSSSVCSASLPADLDADQTLSLPALPNFFEGVRVLYFGDEIDAGERKQLTRLIVAFGGAVDAYMSDATTHVVSRRVWDADFDLAHQHHPRVVFVTPAWVFTSHSAGSRATERLFAVPKQ